MDPVFKFPASPGTPLFPISPERANRQHPHAQLPHEQQLPHSPSLPTLPHYLHQEKTSGHVRGSSDVQGKVAQFNGLAKEAAQRRKDNEAALKRAVLGREEAEGESRRLRESNERLRLEVEEGRGRERRVAGLVELLQDELQRLKEAQAHERSIFEKEVRRARKEAFKSSSALVSLQEELRGARNKYTLMREEMESQRRGKDAREQEALQSQSQIDGLLEELEALKKKLSVTEEERNGLLMAFKEDEVAKAAAQGAIALPSPEAGDEFASPRKRRRSGRESLKENMDPLVPVQDGVDHVDEELKALKEDLRLEKRLRTKAEEESHYLKMECQFGVCSCRIAEMQGDRYIHDGSFDVPLQGDSHNEAPKDMKLAVTPENMAIDPAITTPPAVSEPEIQHVIFSPSSGTFSKAPSPIRPDFAQDEPAISASDLATPQLPEQEGLPTSPIPNQHEALIDAFPQTPRPLPNPPIRHSPRTISTTTLVPLNGITPLFSPAPGTPNGISREEALEQIRLRRGRARSFAIGLMGSAAKAAEGGRREISAPVGKAS